MWGQCCPHFAAATSVFAGAPVQPVQLDVQGELCSWGPWGLRLLLPPDPASVLDSAFMS